mgnify:CR=1 FL=1
MKTLQPGDEVISTNDLYGGSYRLFTKVYTQYGIKFHFVNMGDLANIEAKVNDKTRLIWVETPTNPMMNIIDVAGAAAIAKKHNVLLAVDNTFATPYLQTPLDLGADIVMHSVTKYLGGHSDVVAGVVSGSKAHMSKIFYSEYMTTGAGCTPFHAWLLLRGLPLVLVRPWVPVLARLWRRLGAVVSQVLHGSRLAF